MAPFTRPCPHCGATLPPQARFCGACGHALPSLVEEERDKERGGLVVLPVVPGAAGTAAPGLAASAQTGAPGVASLTGSPQTGVSSLPGASSGPQSAAPGVPSAAAGPQWGAPSMPSLPGAAQAGSSVLQGVAAGTGRGVLFTLPAKIMVVVLVVAVVAGGTVAVVAATGTKMPLFGSGGSGASQASALQPTITVLSDYHVGTTPAGAASTVLHISGRSFAAHSAITFLLDGTPVPGAPAVQSDASGQFTADLTISAAWVVGSHRLSAKDAQGNHSQPGILVKIVAPGQAHTAGPNGAPPDDASFTITISLGYHARLHLPANPRNLLLVLGHPDPMGGTVCGPHDTGQPYSYPDPGESASPGLTDTFTTTCSGSYQGGKLIYTATIAQATYTFSNGVRCTITAATPWTYQVEGTFTGTTTISGLATERRGAEPETCSNGFTTTDPPSTGVPSWTGTLSTQP